MTELPNFPFVDQLNSPTKDGRPDENKWYNCVPASVVACLRYITGNKDYVPDQLKDLAYGENWVNLGTSASEFIDYCASQGVRLYSVENNSCTEAVNQAHRLIKSPMSRPVIFTQQDDYSSNPNFTHVCVWFAEDNGTLTCMDPFGSKRITYSDSVWINRLRSTQLWSVEKMTDTPVVPSGWHDDGTTLVAPNGVHVVLGFRKFVLFNNWESSNIPLGVEEWSDHVDPFDTSSEPGSNQFFTNCSLRYTVSNGVRYGPVGRYYQDANNSLVNARNQAAILQSKVNALNAIVSNADIQAAAASLSKLEEDLKGAL